MVESLYVGHAEAGGVSIAKAVGDYNQPTVTADKAAELKVILLNEM